ncbi:MAG: RHS repeat-associated core domain-containing protein [Bacteroidales bacterium]|nr:RHS repeat-associated core domain-containing protein [Bacteroidales bacterium]
MLKTQIYEQSYHYQNSTGNLLERWDYHNDLIEEWFNYDNLNRLTFEGYSNHIYGEYHSSTTGYSPSGNITTYDSTVVKNSSESIVATQRKEYIHSPFGELIAIRNNGNLQAVATDHLGSIVAEYNPLILNSPSSILNYCSRGYTGHEHLDMFGLINMNGRLYDPMIGRMLSPDPFVQSPTFTQNYNRYSYVLNNPLKYIDPTGYIFQYILDNLDFFFDGLSYDGNGSFSGTWLNAGDYGWIRFSGFTGFGGGWSDAGIPNAPKIVYHNNSTGQVRFLFASSRNGGLISRSLKTIQTTNC